VPLAGKPWPIDSGQRNVQLTEAFPHVATLSRGCTYKDDTVALKEKWNQIFGHRGSVVDAEDALPGRDTRPYDVPEEHAVLGTKITPPFPDGMDVATVALGCFWGAERLFWELDGVWTTAVGYAGGHTPNPTYEETCTGKTGHAEAVMVVFNPEKISYEKLLKTFFEAHDPTQGMRQGGDIGSQYRSAIYTHDERQRQVAERMLREYDAALSDAGKGSATTELAEAGEFYYAEDYHQQYLHKVPHGYCSLKGTGVACAIAPEPAPVSGGEHDTATDSGLKPIPDTEDEWKRQLGPEQYKVLRQAGTERPFTGEYNAVFDEGTYRCAACGNPLFDSSTKYDHGCGWPSFGEALPEAVTYIDDNMFGMRRTEVRCARCDSHLGHVFNDGPKEYDGARFCMNSVAIDLDEK
jgi:peptide-methionine (S)-S-oxide reductase